MTPIQIKVINHPKKDGKPVYTEEIIVDGVKEPKDSSLGQIQAFDKAPKGWVQLSVVDHAEVFPISGLGQLPEGFAWYLKPK